ncbi:aldo/keto reductase [Actinomadura litoris]|uniref:aldo/keto reductase n=1 Tax=Actinomadura litoris TaxID=2678616 RepID=UPI001FA7940C|nr:aldo/keto reductase [Actinomadura litoris]
MRRRRLGMGSLSVSEQGLGCMGMSFAYGPVNDSESDRTVHRALELGVTLFDTADMYGPHHNESLVGRALSGRRDQAVLSTKVGNEIDRDGALTGRINGRPDYIRSSIDGSLQRLGVDWIDLYTLHRVDPHVPIEESFGALAELVHAGKVRHLGLSEASAATIRRAHAVHPVTAVQTEYSLFSRDVETNGVLATTRELNIGFVAYSPLGRGFLSGRIRDIDDLPEKDFRRVAPRFQETNFHRNLKVVERIERVAESKGVTASQLSLAWVLAQGSDVVAIPGTKRRTYLEENVAVSAMALTPDELATLDVIAPPGVATGDRYPAAAMAYLDG